MSKKCRFCEHINEDIRIACFNCGHLLEDISTYKQISNSFDTGLNEISKSIQELKNKAEQDINRIVNSNTDSYPEINKPGAIPAPEPHTTQPHTSKSYPTQSTPGPAPSQSSSSLDENPSHTQQNIAQKYPYQKIDLYKKINMNTFDEKFHKLFNLKTYKSYDFSKIKVPGFLCTELEDFYEVMFINEDISDENKKNTVDYICENIKKSFEKNKILTEAVCGVFIPGIGCFINGWACARLVEPNIATDKSLNLFSNKKVSDFIMQTIFHEKYGHGFLHSFTQYGKECEKLGLWKHRLCSQLNFKLYDTPEFTLIDEKWKLLFNSSNFTDEGWSTYIETFLTGHKPKYTFKNIKYNLNQFINSDSELFFQNNRDLIKDITNSVFSLIDKISDDDLDDINALHSTILFMQENQSQLSEIFSPVFGQPMPYVLGCALFDKIFKKFGPEIVPLLLSISGNINYTLDKISVKDLEYVINKNPMLNIDTRTLMMSKIPEKLKTIEKIKSFAKNNYNMALPDGDGCNM